MIERFPSGPFATNAYVVFCTDTKDAAIIDPAPESSSRLLAFLRKSSLNLVKILLTHSHWDHFADLKSLLDVVKVPVYVHPLDAKNVSQPGSDGLPLLIPIEGVESTHTLKEGDEILVGKLTFKVLETPGHSPGGVCFYCAKSSVLISGDTLFKGSIGNLSFPTAEPEKMWSSLEKLSQLPQNTRIYPGHGDPTTLKEEGWIKNAKKIFN